MKYDAKNLVGVLRLRDVAHISAGYPIRGSVESAPSGDVPVIQLRDVDGDGRISWVSPVRVRLTGRRAPDWLEQGDILFAARGARNVAALVGAVPGPAVCSPHFFLIRMKAADVLPAFVAWQINQEPAQRYLAAASQGSNIRSIKRQTLEELPLAKASAARQRAIIELNDAALREKRVLSSLIENRNRQMQALASAVCSAATGGQPDE